MGKMHGSGSSSRYKNVILIVVFTMTISIFLMQIDRINMIITDAFVYDSATADVQCDIDIDPLVSNGNPTQSEVAESHRVSTENDPKLISSGKQKPPEVEEVFPVNPILIINEHTIQSKVSAYDTTKTKNKSYFDIPLMMVKQNRNGSEVAEYNSAKPKMPNIFDLKAVKTDENQIGFEVVPLVFGMENIVVLSQDVYSSKVVENFADTVKHNLTNGTASQKLSNDVAHTSILLSMLLNMKCSSDKCLFNNFPSDLPIEAGDHILLKWKEFSENERPSEDAVRIENMRELKIKEPKVQSGMMSADIPVYEDYFEYFEPQKQTPDDVPMDASQTKSPQHEIVIPARVLYEVLMYPSQNNVEHLKKQSVTSHNAQEPSDMFEAHQVSENVEVFTAASIAEHIMFGKVPPARSNRADLDRNMIRRSVNDRGHKQHIASLDNKG